MESIESIEKVGSTYAHDVTVDTHFSSIQSRGHGTDHTIPVVRTEKHRLPENDVYEENCINLSLLDPARYGWMAVGGVADLSTPHEVRRRI